MSKFDYMNFEGGEDTEFVAHAKKFTKEQIINICIAENDWKFEGKYPYRKPMLSDIEEDRVKYFVNKPEYCGLDTVGGCYTFCGKDAKGSFPVWVIRFEKLKDNW